MQILMATRNGGEWLAGQLGSFAAQSYGNWSLLAGDDASTDGTRECLDRFAAAHPGRVAWREGPGRGSAANFLTLAQRSSPGSWVAFSDQDDVWNPDRLERALAASAPVRPEEPVVYASATLLTDAALRPLGPSSLPPPRGVSFGNALVQNVLAGNTLVLSPGAGALLRQAAPAALAADVPFHDWWIYQLMTGAGVRIVYDPEPGLMYRQHGGNVLGAHRGIAAGLSRAGQILRRDYAGWIDRNTAALAAVESVLTDDARRLLGGFAAARRKPEALRALGICRQTRAGDRALTAMARTGRL
ncbi:glycosyltransferase [Histidinibacterium lentulum]|uniref:Glycosyltransferase n=1 Tax=Histidinibacterium lentulum TaxID=2480588 RepID=A0A3N2R684_9RHOB|nr:glycosyltransferase [Histidinibacterium lentulum]